jgi:hypothetical protein
MTTSPEDIGSWDNRKPLPTLVDVARETRVIGGERLRVVAATRNHCLLERIFDFESFKVTGYAVHFYRWKDNDTLHVYPEPDRPLYRSNAYGSDGVTGCRSPLSTRACRKWSPAWRRHSWRSAGGGLNDHITRESHNLRPAGNQPEVARTRSRAHQAFTEPGSACGRHPLRTR